MFEGLYGLSCVENQVLAFLRQQEVDVAPLYYNSAVPLKELFFFMVIQGMSPVRFDRVGRIQDDLRAIRTLLVNSGVTRIKTASRSVCSDNVSSQADSSCSRFSKASIPLARRSS